MGEGFLGKIIDHVVNKRFKENYKLTIGVNILTMDVEFEEERCNLRFWDIAWNMRFFN